MIPHKCEDFIFYKQLDGEINPINEGTTHIVINHFIVIGQTKKTARESIPGIIGANDIMIYRPLLRAAEDAA